MSYRRTQEHRALRAALIKKWKPWEHSTGPKTKEGKLTAAKNAFKHGNRSKDSQNELAALKRLIDGYTKNDF